MLSYQKAAAVAGLILAAQAALSLTTARSEAVPLIKPLTEFPKQVKGWSLFQEGVVEEEVQRVLKADDLLTREYRREGLPPLNFFVAYFRTQRTGKSPHSPKNCLPGAGWVDTQSGVVGVNVGGEKIEINKYIVQRGVYKSLVLYWYQSHSRVIASEYYAKIFLVLDSMRYNRSDVAIVRVVVPIIGDDVSKSMNAGIEFVQGAYPEMKMFLPPSE